MKAKTYILGYLSTLLFYLAILIFIIGFSFIDTPTGPFWYQQFLPNIGGRQIMDIMFIDSLTGYAVTSNITQNDTGFVLKTTNSGDNWTIKFTDSRYFTKIKFIDSNTGFATGGAGNGAKIYKTTNAGSNWLPQNIPGGGQLTFEDMSVLSEATFWVVASNSLVGGVFYTANGGASWTQQLALGNQNPDHIYMFNARIGFVSKVVNTAVPYIRKTIDGGLNWTIIVNNDGFRSMYFVDSLTGWKTMGDTMKYTSNGGQNWNVQLMPYGGMIESNVMTRFTVINKDTLWGCGGWLHYPNNQYRGILYRTTNAGINWLFQVPDTSIQIASYEFINFKGKNNGWSYANYLPPTGIHTTNGGDTTFIAGVRQISTQIPKQFLLYQNYPNPFNPKTNIKYQITASPRTNGAYPSEGGEHEVKLIIYDITGREIIKLVNQRQRAGTYQVDFSGSNLSSGIYFYSLLVDGQKIETRKMLMIK